MPGLDVLKRYGIKEVCDVTFYEINSNGMPGAPVLYLDSLKISTMEQTAENTSARGGKGNPERIIWDYNREATVSLQDCVFSPQSMAIMYGAVDENGRPTLVELNDYWLLKTVKASDCHDAGTEGSPKYVTNIRGREIELKGENGSGNPKFYNVDGTEAEGGLEDCAYVTGYVKVTGSKITISSDTFAGTYYVTGDTYARSEDTGKDESFQLVFPKLKVLSESTLTMEAEGDPSVFDMSTRVLVGKDNEMVHLIKYDFDEANADSGGTGGVG